MNTMTKELRAVPSINWHEFKQRYQSNIKLGKEIIESFTQQLSHDINDILFAYKNQDYQKMSFATHKLRGASVYACTQRLTSILTQIEQHLRLDQHAELEPLTSFLSQELSSIFTESKNNITSV